MSVREDASVPKEATLRCKICNDWTPHIRLKKFRNLCACERCNIVKRIDFSNLPSHVDLGEKSTDSS